MIIATAGHVDHGKTALVKALTGVDTDRLPEEKARGLSIDLGFAYRQTPEGCMIGMVDVPGHERFVHTMVAGVAGIHHALLVVAADDGPMPQTREHIAILDIMGVSSATLAVTKIDRVDAARLEEVEAQTRALLDATGISVLESFRVCALNGEGIPALQAHLDRLARAWSPPAPRGGLRFAVDRSFTLEGVGVVVTGMMAAGCLSVGDSVITCPGAVHARVRNVRAHDRAAQSAQAGERCALNLTGADVHAKAIARGDWIVAEDACYPTRRIDAALRSCAGQSPVRQGARIHVHLGAKEATGRLVWLGDPDAGRDDWAQILLDEPVGALWGDRVLVRDWSASATLAGGRVVDPFAGGGTRAERLALLQALGEPDPVRSLSSLVSAQTNGVDLERFARSRNLRAEESEALFSAVPMVQVDVQGRRLAFDAARWQNVREEIIREVEQHHDKNPESWGPEEASLRSRFGTAGHRSVFAAQLQELIEKGRLARMGSRLHRPGRRPELSARQRSLWQRIEPVLADGGLRPLSIGPLAATVDQTPVEMAAFLAELAKRGYLLQVAHNRFFLPQAVLALACAARELAGRTEQGRFTAADFRDHTGIGRNLSIEVLEYFDRCGLTRRAGERRLLVKPPEQVFG